MSRAALMASASVVLLTVVGCGSASPKNQAQSSAASTQLTTAWCGVDKASLAGSPGVSNAKGWTNAKLPIHIKQSTQITAAQKTEIAAAMKTWETAVGKTLFVIDGTDDKKGSDFSSLNASLDDTSNGQYFDDQWDAHTGKPTSVLGTTVFRTDPDNVILQADIRFNVEHFDFGDADDTALATQARTDDKTVADIQTVATHELGHLLGLAHIEEADDANSIMHPAVSVGPQQKKRTLSDGDVKRIKAIYAN